MCIVNENTHIHIHNKMESFFAAYVFLGTMSLVESTIKDRRVATLEFSDAVQVIAFGFVLLPYIAMGRFIRNDPMIRTETCLCNLHFFTHLTFFGIKKMRLKSIPVQAEISILGFAFGLLVYIWWIQSDDFIHQMVLSWVIYDWFRCAITFMEFIQIQINLPSETLKYTYLVAMSMPVVRFTFSNRPQHWVFFYLFAIALMTEYFIEETTIHEAPMSEEEASSGPSSSSPNHAVYSRNVDVHRIFNSLVLQNQIVYALEDARPSSSYTETMTTTTTTSQQQHRATASPISIDEVTSANDDLSIL